MFRLSEFMRRLHRHFPAAHSASHFQVFFVADKQEALSKQKKSDQRFQTEGPSLDKH
jgi:hypothetical protein